MEWLFLGLISLGVGKIVANVIEDSSQKKEKSDIYKTTEVKNENMYRHPVTGFDASTEVEKEYDSSTFANNLIVQIEQQWSFITANRSIAIDKGGLDVVEVRSRKIKSHFGYELIQFDQDDLTPPEVVVNFYNTDRDYNERKVTIQAIINSRGYLKTTHSFPLSYEQNLSLNVMVLYYYRDLVTKNLEGYLYGGSIEATHRQAKTPERVRAHIRTLSQDKKHSEDKTNQAWIEARLSLKSNETWVSSHYRGASKDTPTIFYVPYAERDIKNFFALIGP